MAGSFFKKPSTAPDKGPKKPDEKAETKKLAVYSRQDIEEGLSLDEDLEVLEMDNKVYYKLGKSDKAFRKGKTYDATEQGIVDALNEKPADKIIGLVDGTEFRKKPRSKHFYNKNINAANQIRKCKHLLDKKTLMWYDYINQDGLIDEFADMGSFDKKKWKKIKKNKLFLDAKGGIDKIYAKDGLFNFLLAWKRVVNIQKNLGEAHKDKFEVSSVKLKDGSVVLRFHKEKKKQDFRYAAKYIDLSDDSIPVKPPVKPEEEEEDGASGDNPNTNQSGANPDITQTGPNPSQSNTNPNTNQTGPNNRQSGANPDITQAGPNNRQSGSNVDTNQTGPNNRQSGSNVDTNQTGPNNRQSGSNVDTNQTGPNNRQSGSNVDTDQAGPAPTLNQAGENEPLGASGEVPTNYSYIYAEELPPALPTGNLTVIKSNEELYAPSTQGEIKEVTLNSDRTYEFEETEDYVTITETTNGENRVAWTIDKTGLEGSIKNISVETDPEYGGPKITYEIESTTHINKAKTDNKERTTTFEAEELPPTYTVEEDQFEYNIMVYRSTGELMYPVRIDKSMLPDGFERPMTIEKEDGSKAILLEVNGHFAVVQFNDEGSMSVDKYGEEPTIEGTYFLNFDKAFDTLVCAEQGPGA